MPIDTIKLGTQDAVVSREGLGCIGMSECHGGRNDKEPTATLLRTLDFGTSFLGTADVYGIVTTKSLSENHQSSPRRILSDKEFANICKRDRADFLGVSGKPEDVKQACDASSSERSSQAQLPFGRDGA